MSFASYIPQPPLSEHVHMLWSWQGYHPPHAMERILPGGMIDITFNLAEGPFRVSQDGEAMRTIDGPMAAGARTRSFLIDTAAPMSLLSVWFKPGGAVAFLGPPGTCVRDTHLALETLWGSAATTLHERLLAAPTTRARFELLERALLDRLRHARVRHPAVRFALDRFQAAPHETRVQDVVSQIALSPTRFIRLFRDDVGMTPKQFCRVQRFQRALSMRARRPTASWVEVALRCGYYDQAHFINEFRRIAGIAPSAYTPQSREHHSNLPVDGVG